MESLPHTVFLYCFEYLDIKSRFLSCTLVNHLWKSTAESIPFKEDFCFDDDCRSAIRNWRLEDFKRLAPLIRSYTTPSYYVPIRKEFLITQYATNLVSIDFLFGWSIQMRGQRHILLHQLLYRNQNSLKKLSIKDEWCELSTLCFGCVFPKMKELKMCVFWSMGDDFNKDGNRPFDSILSEMKIFINGIANMFPNLEKLDFGPPDHIGDDDHGDNSLAGLQPYFDIMEVPRGEYDEMWQSWLINIKSWFPAEFLRKVDVRVRQMYNGKPV